MWAIKEPLDGTAYPYLKHTIGLKYGLDILITQKGSYTRADM